LLLLLADFIVLVPLVERLPLV
jgi:hypothetical protein